MAKSNKGPVEVDGSRFDYAGAGNLQNIDAMDWDPGTLASPHGLAGGQQIQVYHIPTGQAVEFAAFITEFADSFDSNWDSQEVYGRPDPIMNYKNTTRTISLAWDVPSRNLIDSQRNMAEINRLVQFLYPTYNEGTTRTIEGSPLVKIQFQNLIASGKGSASKSNALSLGIDAKLHGLIAAITSLSVTPDLEQGTFST